MTARELLVLMTQEPSISEDKKPELHSRNNNEAA